MTKSIYEKSWIIEGQALKAAEKAGWSEAEARAQLRKDGKKYYFLNPADVAAMQKGIKAAFDEAREQGPVGARQSMDNWINEFKANIQGCQSLNAIPALYDLLNAKKGLTDSVREALDEAIGARALQIEADEALTRTQIKHAPGNKPGWVHASSVQKPTKLVWVIADEMYAEAQNAGKPMPTRKEVQDECVRRGIASGTARTQFQHWFKVHNENPERATIDPVTGKIIPPAK